jgi:hypothetical protein
MNLKDILFNQLLITIIYIVILTSVINAIMSFVQVKRTSYIPFLYFFIALLIMNSFLEKKTGFK